MSVFRGKVLIRYGLSLQGVGSFPVGMPVDTSGFGIYCQRLAGLIFVVLTVVLVGAGKLFKEVGVLDRGGDFVVAARPFAEVDAAAAVGAEGEVFAACEHQGAAGGAAQRFRFRGGRLRHRPSLILFRSATK
jgi:hypothetical protein